MNESVTIKLNETEASFLSGVRNVATNSKVINEENLASVCEIFTILEKSVDIIENLVIPSDKLIKRISGNKSGFVYFFGGKSISDVILPIIKKYNQNNDRINLLDWGCGCGRIYQTLDILKNNWIDYKGIDIDNEVIKWCQNNLDTGKFEVSNLFPPLAVGNKEFDVVIGISVMTHLNYKNQQIWLKEISRILKPNGLFLCSVHGENAANIVGFSKQIREKEFYDELIDNALGDIVPNNYYRATFQTEEFTHKNWTKYFNIIEYIPKGVTNFQDLVVMKNK